MNFMLIPSLEHVALVSVAASLWNQHDVRTSVTKFTNSPLFSKYDPADFIGLLVHRSERKETWRKIEEKVIEKVPQLEIPAILKEKILGFIQAVGLQILRWMEYHHRYMDFFNFGLPNQFFWTPQGTVDRKKTAEILVKDENIGIFTRYIFACIYCLENDVPKLWNRLPESIQKKFVDVKDIGKNMQTDLLIFWEMHLHGELATLGSIIRQRLNLECSAYEYMFISAAKGGNKVATEYFLQKLVPRNSLSQSALFQIAVNIAARRCKNLVTGPPKEYDSEIVCFLLSQMNDEQQVKVLEKFSIRVSLIFLDWPWQRFFVNTACRLWNFLHEHRYHGLLLGIIHKILSRCTDYNYQKVFGELWQQTPLSHKRYILCDSIGGILHPLLEFNDRENLKLVIQDATLSEKNAFIFGDIGLRLCHDRVHQPDLLKFLIHLFISSKDEMIKFKQKYEEYVERIRETGCTQTQFLKFLDDLIRRYDKRSVDGSDSSAPKRLRTIYSNDTAHNTKSRRRRSFPAHFPELIVFNRKQKHAGKVHLNNCIT